MAQVNVPRKIVLGSVSKANYSTAIARGLAVVPDSTNDNGVKVPANGADNTLFGIAGIVCEDIALGTSTAPKYGRIAQPGDTVPMLANGAITKGDLLFITTTTAGKEGRVKTYVNFATNGAVLMVGFANTTAADGEYVEVQLTGFYVKTA